MRTRMRIEVVDSLLGIVGMFVVCKEDGNGEEKK